jgi:DNA-binding MarR family transcriptional regulator
MMDEHTLREQIQIFVRQFGLLEQEHTPCHVPLTPSQAHAFQVLGQAERLTQSQLAEALHLEKSTVSRLVQSLVERGWVERTSNPDNRREVLLSLTDAGHAQFAEVQAHATARYHTIWSRILQDQRAQVLDALVTLNTILQEEKEQE